MALRPEKDTPGSDATEILATRAGYDRWAAIYDGEDNPLVALEEPQMAAALGSVAGLTVADIGCGTGRHALHLAAAGARVTALDFSEEMLRKARAKPGAAAVTFVVHDLAEPLPVRRDAADLPAGGVDRRVGDAPGDDAPRDHRAVHRSADRP